MTQIYYEYYQSREKASKRVNEIKRFSGNFDAMIIQDGHVYEVRYWRINE